MTGMMRRMIDESGAEIILPLGGALVPWIIDPRELEDSVKAPVLHTHRIAIAFAEMCARTGLSHSPLAYETVRGLTYEDFTGYAHR